MKHTFWLFRLLFILLLGNGLIACSPDAQNASADKLTDAASAKEVSATQETEKPAKSAELPEVIVLVGMEQLMERLKQENWWGEENRDEQLTVPHLMIARIHPQWRIVAQDLPVPQKKEIFYRLMLPLVMHANEMVLDRRAKLLQARDDLASGKQLTNAELEQLRQAAVLLRVMTEEDAAALTLSSPELNSMLDDMLHKLDVVPAGLALGQAAYESGYGTSRFAAEGNALFGQWTYGGGGMAPQQKRASKGDYGIAAFEWPFDSVRGYFINLMSHPAYEDFRRLRAEMRAAGEPLSSLKLADGLVRYSERGQEYVDALKGMIRVNGLDIADDAVFRDEPMRFILTEGTPEEAADMKQRIADAADSGELAEIIARMRLE
jgi:Bax protein